MVEHARARTRGYQRVCSWIALLALWGCGDSAEPIRPTQVEAEVSEEVATVVTVRWTTERPTIGYVEYGPTEDFGEETPIEVDPSRRHSVNLLGLRSDTEYHYRVVIWDGDQAGASGLRSVRTRNLPGGVPRLDVEGDGHDQYTIVPILGATTAVTILDPEGEIVWYHTDDRDLDFYRARLSLDRTSILYNAASISGDPSEDSELVRVSLDGKDQSSIPVPLLAHDFVEHADGTLGAIAVEYRDFEGTMLRGDKIVEIDPDGEQTTIWTSWDCFDPAESPGDDIDNGWTFANALDYDPGEDAYTLGMRNFSSITKIDRQTGECEWVLGLTASTIDFAPGSARFLHQHQFELKGTRLLVMDNDGSPGNVSRVIEYDIDFDAAVATEIQTYVSDPPIYTFVLGEPMRLGTDLFVNWGAAGQMERVNEDGEVTWKLNSQAGAAFGFHTLQKSLYP